MFENFNLDNLVDLYTLLNKEEFIESLSRYFDVEPKYLLLLKKYYYNDYKQAIIDIYIYRLVSNPCQIYIYQTFISKWNISIISHNSLVSRSAFKTFR